MCLSDEVAYFQGIIKGTVHNTEELQLFIIILW